MKMIVVPNSCFSVLFVDPRFHDIRSEQTILVNLPSSHVQVEIHGEWVLMNINVIGLQLSPTGE